MTQQDPNTSADNNASCRNEPFARNNTIPPATVKIKNPIKWRAVFAESLLIGASIILAFALQDWDEAKDIEERTLIALCNVKSELIFNRILIENEYIPRQRGMLSLSNAAILQLRGQQAPESLQTDIEQMLIQEALRYSAWRLAGESGYLLHADFQLATEIGSLFNYQNDKYQNTINRVNEKVLNFTPESNQATIEYYASLSRLVNDWINQTRYLHRKYNALFSVDSFNQLGCE
ncbi:MAG: hypothetical protein AAGJ37_13985 [Pseudomonadota bacterium]